MKTMLEENLQLQLRLQLKESAIPPTDETAVSTPNIVGSSKESAVAKVKEPAHDSFGNPQQTSKV